MNDPFAGQPPHRRDALTFVLPVALGTERSQPGWRATISADISRIQLHLAVASLMGRFDLRDLGRFLIVTRARDAAEVTGVIRRITEDARVQVLIEDDVCPEISSPEFRGVSGWRVQQVLKLAIANLVKTEFYLALDADTLCVRPCGLGSYVAAGRARTNVQHPSDYIRLYRGWITEWFTKWQRVHWASRVLGLTRPRRHWFRYYGETPALLHTRSVQRMAEHIQSRYRTCWREALLRLRRWTEYPLYYGFLEATGGLEKHHELGDRRTVLDLDASIWHSPGGGIRPRRTPDYGNFPILDDVGCRGHFVVVQTWFDAGAWLPPEFRDLRAYYLHVARRLGHPFDFAWAGGEWLD